MKIFGHIFTFEFSTFGSLSGSNSQHSDTVMTTVHQHGTNMATKSTEQVFHWQTTSKSIEQQIIHDDTTQTQSSSRRRLLVSFFLQL